jgi:hypothetical protein
MTVSDSTVRPAPMKVSPIADGMTMRSKAITIVTARVLHVAQDRIWDSLMFYEQIEQQPPLLLRLLLPRPIRTEGSKEEVGDVATCVYAQGHLLKQVTSIKALELYEFRVIEQQLFFGGGLRLLGGGYTLERLSPTSTKVSVTTRYECLQRPRFLWRPIESMVCHAFHRYLLAAIEKKALSSSSAPGSAHAARAS